jgi:hypothetical protein
MPRIRSKSQIRWRCAEGHEWVTSFQKVKMGQWCGVCAGLKKKTIEYCQRLAEKRGGECISEEYTNCNVGLEWRCAKGHTWETSYRHVEAGTWCPFCANKAKGSIETCQELAKKHDGKCLSTKYINARTKLIWECSKGHQWLAAPTKIKTGAGMRTGTWCPVCAGKLNSPNIIKR